MPGGILWRSLSVLIERVILSEVSPAWKGDAEERDL